MTEPTLKPWMEWNGKGWLLCMMCPMSKTTHRGTVQYYLGVRWGKATLTRRANWLRAHRRCGFEVEGATGQ